MAKSPSGSSRAVPIEPPRRKKRILLLIESSRATGCGLIQGISQYVRQYSQWIIRIDEDRNMSESNVRRIANWNG
ncbi:MAG: hypothetical protein FWE67_05905, partial [Planctomycetaceae bacterium]|nr:hypothetical protein [Planctomycetaceae bacterium]